MPNIDKTLEEILKRYHPNPRDAVWKMQRGKTTIWIAYHKALEVIAAAAGITFDRPQIIEARGADGVAALCVTGHLGDKTEWSIGEASPKNNKNEYPWAMSEKRAKDRVILKLLGLHGDVYSEEEADDFKEGKPQKLYGPLGKSALQKAIRELTGDVASCDDYDQIVALLNSSKEILEQCERDEPSWWFGGEDKHGEKFVGLKERIDVKTMELSEKESS